MMKTMHFSALSAAAVSVSVAAVLLLAGCSPDGQQATAGSAPPAADLPHAVGTDISTLKKKPSQHTPAARQAGTALAGDFEAAAVADGEDGWGGQSAGEGEEEAPLLMDVAAETMPPPRRRSDAEMAASSEQNPVEITWDQLIPADYSSEEALAAFQDQIAAMDDNDPGAEELYRKIIREINNAPADEAVHGKWIRLPGFIAPLTQDGGQITEFLLVPYFGACIHSPPPPINQTVLVQAAADNGIAADDAYYPVWVMGQIEVESHPTDIGAAGYVVKNARIERYDEL